MIAKSIQSVLYWPGVLLLKLMFKFEVRGQGNLKPVKDRAIIFAANHGSYIDGLILTAAMPIGFLPISFLVTERFFRWRGWYILSALLLNLSGCVRLTKNGHAFKHVIARLKKSGARIMIFPTGGWDDDGKPLKAKPGVAYLFRESGAVLVPVGISGNFGIEFRKTLIGVLAGKRKIAVNFGEPILSLPNFLSLEQVTQEVMGEIESLIKEVENEKAAPQADLQGIQ